MQSSGSGATFNLNWASPGVQRSTLLSTAVSYDPASTAIFNSWASNSCSVSLTEKGYVDTWVKAAKADGTFNKMAGAYFLQSKNSCSTSNADAYTNWISPASLAVASGTVTCTTTYCKGIVGLGFLDTGITVASAGGSQNNIAIGAYLNAGVANGSYEIGTTNLFMETAAGSQVATRVNNGGNVNFGTTTTGLSAVPWPGGFAVSRNASSTSFFGAEKDGSNQIIYGNNSSAPSANSIYLLSSHNGGGANSGNGGHEAFAFIASSTSVTDIANILTDAYNYLVSIGAQ